MYSTSRPGRGQKAIPISDLPPTNPSNSDMWWHSHKGRLYIWYEDGDSGQWVSTTSAPADSKLGWLDYNHNGGAITLSANTWTDLPNNGLGAFTNKNYPPSSVSEVLDTSTGYLDFNQLSLGSELLLRTDVSVTPDTDKCLFEMRYLLGGGAGEYPLKFYAERLDSGSGTPYERVTSFPIYMGDLNTQGNPGRLQARLSTNGTIINNGVYASIRLR